MYIYIYSYVTVYSLANTHRFYCCYSYIGKTSCCRLLFYRLETFPVIREYTYVHVCMYSTVAIYL